MRKIDEKYHIENDEIIRTSDGFVVPLADRLILLREKDFFPQVEPAKHLQHKPFCTSLSKPSFICAKCGIHKQHHGSSPHNFTPGTVQAECNCYPLESNS